MTEVKSSKGRPKILVAGSFVMDQIAITDVLPKPGQSVLGKTFHKAPGGKGANQAVQAARLGADVTLFGKIGDDANGMEMLDICQKAGIHTENIVCEKGSASGCAIILLKEQTDGSMENRILVLPGTNMTISQEEASRIYKIVPNFDMVMLQLEIPIDINKTIAGIAAEHGIPVMLNPAPFAPIPKSLFPYLHYISPNETEAEDLTGIHIGHEGREFDSDAALRAAQSLRDRGVENVLITIGSAGAVLLNKEGFFVSPGIEGIQAVDPTAAGDSFIAAFCTAVSAGAGAKDAMYYANHTAALTVSRMGAMPSLPTSDEVKKFMTKKEV